MCYSVSLCLPVSQFVKLANYMYVIQPAVAFLHQQSINVIIGLPLASFPPFSPQLAWILKGIENLVCGRFVLGRFVPQTVRRT